MTGYEILVAELSKEFHVAKIKNNKPFIEAIVRILAEDNESKIALSLAEEKMKEAKNVYAEADVMLKKAERLYQKVTADESSNREQFMMLNRKEDELRALEKRLNSLETAEARDKVRLAYYYESHAHADGTTLARGLSNILGNGGSKKTEM